MMDKPRFQEPTLEARLALRSEPDETPLIYQTWNHLLFMHWEWDAGEIQKTLPPGLRVDTWHGKAYLAVAPFAMNDIRASFLPEIPGMANLLELNVRTYVYDENGNSGVWFYSLDCNQGLAVLLARMFYSLPYRSAVMELKERAELMEYRSHREGAREATEIHYRQKPEPLPAPPGSLPFFLVERYLLFAWSKVREQLNRARVWHMPYQLFHAHLGRWDDTMLHLNGFNPNARRPDHVCIAAPMRVKIYALK